MILKAIETKLRDLLHCSSSQSSAQKFNWSNLGYNKNNLQMDSSLRCYSIWIMSQNISPNPALFTMSKRKSTTFMLKALKDSANIKVKRVVQLML